MSAWENFRLEWSPDLLSTSVPSWQDITAYARSGGGGSPINIATGTPDTGAAAGAARPGTMTVVLENIDHRFTFGNTGSALYPNWKPGRRIRCYETIGCRRFDWFSGYLQAPETDDWADRGVDQFVSVTAVDRLGRLATARAFISTLAEYILYSGSPAAYWSLLDPAGAPYLRPARPSTQLPLNTSFNIIGGTAAPAATFQGGSAIPGDDVGTLRLAPAVNTSMTVDGEANLTGAINPITTSASTFTVAWWVFFEDAHSSNISLGVTNDAGDGYLRLTRVSGAWAFGYAFSGGTSGSTSCSGLRAGQWNLVVLRLTVNNAGTGSFEYWRNDDTQVSTGIAIAPGLFAFSRVNLEGIQGNLAHLQMYNTASGYTSAMHLAQYAEGFRGLASQTTGQRINTLALYAGVASSELTLLDTGTSYMQKATLAGQTPLAEMGVAETTEQGRLRANGAGLLVFASRTRRYQS